MLPVTVLLCNELSERGIAQVGPQKVVAMGDASDRPYQNLSQDQQTFLQSTYQGVDVPLPVVDLSHVYTLGLLRQMRGEDE